MIEFLLIVTVLLLYSINRGLGNVGDQLNDIQNKLVDIIPDKPIDLDDF